MSVARVLVFHDLRDGIVIALEACWVYGAGDPDIERLALDLKAWRAKIDQHILKLSGVA